MRWILLSLLVGCGARTGLETEELEPCVPTSVVEVCDGVDNDCDGLVDEDIDPIRCGEHGCETVVRCVAGVMPLCVPRTPSPEACNLLDDDCDGEIDEGLGFGPLGDAIVLRTDEFDTGGCTSCSWAFGTTLAPAGDGFLALWNLGLSGGHEEPTLYGRLVDRSGRPTSEIELLREDYILGIDPMQALEPLPERGLPLDARYRLDHRDVFGFLFVSSSGETETEWPTPASGPSNRPLTVWTGERFVSAWEQDDGLQVASLSADGTDERRVEVDRLERPGAVTLGVFPGRVGVLVSRYREDPERWDQWFLLLDGRGDVLAPARQIDVEYTSWQRLVGTDEGWLHVRPNRWDEPSTRQVLGVEGDPISPPLAWDDGRHLDGSGLQHRFVLRPGLHEIVLVWQSPEGGEMHVEILDSAGDVLRGWSGPLAVDPGYDQGYLSGPHVSLVDDRILVIWHGLASSAQPNRVYAREFGCVP